MSILDKVKRVHAKPEYLTLGDFLDLIPKEPLTYASVAERLVKAIGEPRLVDTSKDTRLRIIHSNKTIRVYDAFSHVYGIEDTVHDLVSYFKHAAQGLEESRLILNLHGPVGSAKSTLADTLKSLVEQHHIFVLAIKNADGSFTHSPVFETPLGLFTKKDAEALKVPERVFNHLIMSAWARKRINEFEGDISKFWVAKLLPSELYEVGISKVTAGDENTQDTSVLVGKPKLRALAHFDQSDVDAYDFSGGLSKGNQGILEMIEMQKGNIKTLNPLLTATQEHQYTCLESIGAQPFNGLVIAHTNDTEWEAFKSNRKNEALVDRIYPIAVGYNLRLEEEVKIYEKMLKASTLSDAPCSTYVLKGLAEFSIMSRLSGEKGDAKTKMKVYNGESMRTLDANAKTLPAYKAAAAATEGFTGVSTREAFRILAKVFNYDTEEVAANPIYLIAVLNDRIKSGAFDEAQKEKYAYFIRECIVDQAVKQVEDDMKTAHLDTYKSYGQNIYDRYILVADYWLRGEDFIDPQTGVMLSREALATELESLEAAAGVLNAREFRQDSRDFCLRYQARNGGSNPDWRSYESIKKAIDSKVASNLEELLPVLNVNSKTELSEENQARLDSFLKNMEALGYTKRGAVVASNFLLQYKRGAI